MDGMEDSGFDSDPKVMQNDFKDTNPQSDSMDSVSASPENTGAKLLPKASDLQKKLEKQRDSGRKQAIDQQPAAGLGRKMGSSILSRTRLLVPHKPKSLADAASGRADAQPLVMLDSDESDDEFAMPRLSKHAQREITQQLIKDGYNLDLEPDDEDLDLIPPRPVTERCACCPHTYVNVTSCTVM